MGSHIRQHARDKLAFQSGRRHQQGNSFIPRTNICLAGKDGAILSWRLLEARRALATEPYALILAFSPLCGRDEVWISHKLVVHHESCDRLKVRDV